MITVLADKNIPYVSFFLKEHSRLITFDPSQGLPAGVEADALLVRTVTPINARSLPKKLLCKLQFVATASAGTDHIDQAFLGANAISFASAAGCNAQAVAEYVATGLQHWAQSHKVYPHHLRVGIVGAGHTGTATQKLVAKMVASTVVHDPPRARKDLSFTTASKEDILNCDVITFHVPLIEDEHNAEGFDVTRHWLGHDELERSKVQLVINASRGGIVNETALKVAYTSGELQDYILDVWEREPAPIPAVLQDAWIATPHIAGYSIQAKIKATSMVVEQLYSHFGIAYTSDELETEGIPSFESEQGVQQYLSAFEDMKIKDLPDSLLSVIERLHPMFTLSTSLKKGVPFYEEDLIALFTSLRTTHSLRNEYRLLHVPERLARRYPVLQKLTSD